MKTIINLFVIETKWCLVHKFALQLILYMLCIIFAGCATKTKLPELGYYIDVDIDSDNTNIFNEPDRSASEEYGRCSHLARSDHSKER